MSDQSLDLCVCGHEKEDHANGTSQCWQCPWWKNSTCTEYRPAPPVILGPVDPPVETVGNTDAEIKAAIDEAAEGLV